MVGQKGFKSIRFTSKGRTSPRRGLGVSRQLIADIRRDDRLLLKQQDEERKFNLQEKRFIAEQKRIAEFEESRARKKRTPAVDVVFGRTPRVIVRTKGRSIPKSRLKDEIAFATNKLKREKKRRAQEKAKRESIRRFGTRSSRRAGRASARGRAIEKREISRRKLRTRKR